MLLNLKSNPPDIINLSVISTDVFSLIISKFEGESSTILICVLEGILSTLITDSEVFISKSAFIKESLKEISNEVC